MMLEFGEQIQLLSCESANALHLYIYSSPFDSCYWQLDKTWIKIKSGKKKVLAYRKYLYLTKIWKSTAIPYNIKEAPSLS